MVGAPDGPEPTWCVAVGGGAGDRARAHLVHRRAVVHRIRVRVRVRVWVGAPDGPEPTWGVGLGVRAWG